MDQYDRMGDSYIRDNESSLINEYYERPAIRSLIGDVRGLRVLDVGCGPGVMGEWLLEQGAEVVAGDKSAAMIAAAKARLRDRAAVHHVDLEEPLPFSPEEFDVVLASLVAHYVEDWERLFKGFFRVLRDGGRAVVSTHHPFADYRWFDRPNYFATELMSDVWNKGGVDFPVQFWRRPLTAMVRSIRAAGFSIDDLVEPIPLPEAEAIDPDWFRQVSTEPQFLFFRLSKAASQSQI